MVAPFDGQSREGLRTYLAHVSSIRSNYQHLIQAGTLTDNEIARTTLKGAAMSWFLLNHTWVNWDTFIKGLKAAYGTPVPQLKASYDSLTFRRGMDPLQYISQYTSLVTELGWEATGDRAVEEFISKVDDDVLNTSLRSQTYTDLTAVSNQLVRLAAPKTRLGTAPQVASSTSPIVRPEAVGPPTLVTPASAQQPAPSYQSTPTAPQLPGESSIDRLASHLEKLTLTVAQGNTETHKLLKDNLSESTKAVRMLHTMTADRQPRHGGANNGWRPGPNQQQSLPTSTSGPVKVIKASSGIQLHRSDDGLVAPVEDFDLHVFEWHGAPAARVSAVTSPDSNHTPGPFRDRGRRVTFDLPLADGEAHNPAPVLVQAARSRRPVGMDVQQPVPPAPAQNPGQAPPLVPAIDPAQLAPQRRKPGEVVAERLLSSKCSSSFWENFMLMNAEARKDVANVFNRMAAEAEAQDRAAVAGVLSQSPTRSSLKPTSNVSAPGGRVNRMDTPSEASGSGSVYSSARPGQPVTSLLELTGAVDGYVAVLILDTGSCFNVMEERFCRALGYSTKLRKGHVYCGVDGVNRESLGICTINVSIGSGSSRVHVPSEFIVIPDTPCLTSDISVIMGLPYLMGLRANIDLDTLTLVVQRDQHTRHYYPLSNQVKTATVAMLRHARKQLQHTSDAVQFNSSLSTQTPPLGYPYSGPQPRHGGGTGSQDSVNTGIPTAADTQSTVLTCHDIEQETALQHVWTESDPQRSSLSGLATCPDLDDLFRGPSGLTPEQDVDELSVPGWDKPVKVGKQTPPHIREQLIQLLKQKEAAFARSMEDLKEPCSLPPHTINIPPGTAPVVHAERQRPPQHQALIDTMARELHKAGLIRPSISAWRTSMMVIDKHIAPGTDRNSLSLEERKRVVQDLRDVNSRTTEVMATPMPIVEVELGRLADGLVFSLLDVKNAFFQFLLEEASRKYTAFATSDGTWEWVRMPQGLTGSPATFMRGIRIALAGLLNTVAYFDDICVKSERKSSAEDVWQTALHHLSCTLDRLIQYNLKVSAHKSAFLITVLRFTGYIVEKGTIRHDPAKVAPVIDLAPHKGREHLQRFLGFVTYYGRRNIVHLSAKTSHLRRLLKKHVPWVWTDQCEQQVARLKREILATIVLWAPNWCKPMLLTTDYSKTGLAAILSQVDDEGKERPIAFSSRTTSAVESRLGATEGERTAVIYGCRVFYTYLYGRPFAIYTDHAALVYLQRNQDRDSKLGRAGLYLQELEFVVRYKRGKLNSNVDSLSREPVQTQCLETREFLSSIMDDLLPEDQQGKWPTGTSRGGFTIGLVNLLPESSPCVTFEDEDMSGLVDPLPASLQQVTLSSPDATLEEEDMSGLVDPQTALMPEPSWWPPAMSIDSPLASDGEIEPLLPQEQTSPLGRVMMLRQPASTSASQPDSGARPANLAQSHVPQESQQEPDLLDLSGTGDASLFGYYRGLSQRDRITFLRHINLMASAVDVAEATGRQQQLDSFVRLAQSGLPTLPPGVAQPDLPAIPAGTQPGRAMIPPLSPDPAQAQAAGAVESQPLTSARVPVPATTVTSSVVGGGIQGASLPEPSLACWAGHTLDTPPSSSGNPGQQTPLASTIEGAIPRSPTTLAAQPLPRPLFSAIPITSEGTASIPAHDSRPDSDDETTVTAVLHGLPLPAYESTQSAAQSAGVAPVPASAACSVCKGTDPAPGDPLVMCEVCKRLTHASCMEDMLPIGLQPKGDYKCPACCPYELPEEATHGQVRGQYLDVMRDRETLDHLMYRSPVSTSRVSSRAAFYTFDPQSQHVKTKDGRIVPVPEQRTVLAKAAHIRLGHRGARAVADALRLQFYWKGMRDDVRAVIASCSKCAVKGARPLIDKHLHSIPPQPLFEKWTIDLIGPMEQDTVTGNKYILVMVESWSRWTEVAGIPNKQSDTVALALKSHIFYRYGPPKQLACDNGGEFMGAVNELCSEFGTTVVRGAPYHPMSQGAVERANRTLQASLFSLISPDSKNRWMSFLDQAVYSARILTHSFTGYPPYFILFGRQPPAVIPFTAPGQASLLGDNIEGSPTAATATTVSGAGRTAAPVSALALDMARRQQSQALAQPRVEERQAKAQKKNQNDYASRVAASGEETALPASGTLVYVRITGRKRKGDSGTRGPFIFVGPAGTAGQCTLRDGDGQEFAERTNNIIVPPSAQGQLGN